MKKCEEIKSQLLASINGLDYKINGDQEHCIANTLNISFSGVDAEGFFVSLKDDYAFSNGSACNSGSHAPSYVLTSMGLDDKRVSEAIRISWSYDSVADFSALREYVESVI